MAAQQCNPGTVRRGSCFQDLGPANPPVLEPRCATCREPVDTARPQKIFEVLGSPV